MIKYLQMFNINKSLYFLLGIIILVNLIYYRLIVIRLPKDIPFTLSLLGCKIQGTYLIVPLKFTVSTRFMRKMVQKVLTENQKKGIAQTVKSFIENNFTGEKVKREDILIRNIEFFKDPTCPEPILNQTIAKAIFSRMSWTKGLIAKTMGISNQIVVADPKEKSDVRFVVEIAIADQLAKQQGSIQNIIMNSEKPNNMTAIISKGGNKYKDITVNLKINSVFELDIKSGNNAQEMLGGLLGNIRITENGTPYYILCDKPVTIERLQNTRMDYLNDISKLTANDVALQRTSTVIRNIHNDLSLDVIQRNIEIQEHLFQLMSNNLLRQQPSFYVIGRVTQAEVQAEFYRRLEPHINSEIFHNKQNANKFIGHAIVAYNDTIQNIVRNIKQKDAWEGTGFAEIAEELFKT